VHQPSANPTIADDMRRVIASVIAIMAIVLGAILVAGFAAGLLGSAGPDQPSRVMDTWLVLLAFQAAMIVLTLSIGRLFGPLPATLSLHWSADILRRALWPFALTALVMAVYGLFAWVFFRAEMLQDLAVFQRLLSGMQIWLPLLVLVVGAPISEELAFRGFLLGQLRKTRLGYAISAVIAAFAWTLLHLSYTLVGLVDVFLAGLMFSWALWRTGSLWVPIGLHAIYNAIVLALISSSFFHAV
jgi:uncharacterized protein